MTAPRAARPRRELYVNTLVAWAWGQATLLTSVIALPLLTHVLPKPEFGLWAQLLALSALADLADFGMSSVFLRRIAAPQASRHADMTKGASQFYRGSSVLLAAVLLVVCLTPGGLVAPFDGKTQAPDLAALVIITAIVVNFACQPYAIHLMSRGRLDLAQTFGAGPAVIGTLATIVAAYVFKTALAVGAAYALTEVAFDAALVRTARRSASSSVSDRRGPGLSRALWREMAQESWGVLVIELISQLMLVVDATIIGHVVGASSVAIFAVAARAADFVRRFFTPFTQSLFVSLCRSGGADRALVDRHAAVLPWVIIAAGLALGCGVAAVGRGALTLIFGHGYGRAEVALIVMTVAATIRAAYMPAVRRIQADGALGTLPRWFAVGFVLHVGVALLLTSRWSVVGMAAAVLTTSVAFEAAPVVWSLRRHVGTEGGEGDTSRWQWRIAVLGCAGLLILAWLRAVSGTWTVVPSAILAAGWATVAAAALYRYIKSSRAVLIG